MTLIQKVYVHKEWIQISCVLDSGQLTITAELAYSFIVSNIFSAIVELIKLIQLSRLDLGQGIKKRRLRASNGHQYPLPCCTHI